MQSLLLGTALTRAGATSTKIRHLVARDGAAGDARHLIDV